MREIRDSVVQWLEAGEEVALARVVALEGAGGRREGETLALGPEGSRAGSILGGIADPVIIGAAQELEGASYIEIEVGDKDAISAGLACGGLARVLVQRADLVPSQLWAALAGRGPVCLATVVTSGGGPPEAPQPGESLVTQATEHAGRIGGDPAFITTVLDEAGRLLGQGRAARSWVETEEASVLVEAFVPPTRLIVVGDGSLVGALARQCRLLGWESGAADGAADASAAVGELGTADAVVVLSHDHELATPVLRQALEIGCYVGALGSRHTQAERRHRLLADGLEESEVARLHGPVGLDLGSRTPEETALAICAEILAHRSGRDAASLRASSGPING